MRGSLFIFFVSLFLLNCQNSDNVDYGNLPFNNEKGNLTAVIEIPAGTNYKFEYNYTSKQFECELREGKPRTVKYLPYPGNYGFIPGTYMNPNKGGDGDALDVLVLSESLKQGTIVEIYPIGILKLLDGGEEDHKIIALPIDDSLKQINANTFKELDSSVSSIVKTWFCNYKGPGKMQFLAFEDEKRANEEILKWKKK